MSEEPLAHDFCEDPGLLATAGRGQQRQPMKSGMIPVRFSPEMVAAVKHFASGDGVTVSTWIRRLVGRELQRLQPSATAATSAAPEVHFDYPGAPQRQMSQTVSLTDQENLAAFG